MTFMQTAINYWFTIEPYVFVGLTNQSALLYNTLDRVSIESDSEEVINLLRETLQVENNGVVLLTNERYKQKGINDFIFKLRNNFMGDIINVSLSKAKPVQLLPYYNFPNKQDIYKKHNFTSSKNVLENLSEISIHLDSTTDLRKLIPFLQSISGNPIFNIIGSLEEVSNYHELLSFFDQHPAPKNICCSYKDIINLQPIFENNFWYRISVHFPIDIKRWEHARKILVNQAFPVEYIFNVTSDEDSHQTEHIVDQFQIDKYRIVPLYTGDNILFFEENVFLKREDILFTSLTIKDFFSRQAINLYDFGKINIMPNGDVFANLNYPVLGNIYTDDIYKIVHKEVEEGKSWFRIRNQEPCCNCVYQWLCPPPSNYEISIGRPNLCHIK